MPLLSYLFDSHLSLWRPNHLNHRSTTNTPSFLPFSLQEKTPSLLADYLFPPGIGAAIAANLASKGCSLILNYTSDSSAQRTADLAKELQTDHNVDAIAVQADMGSPEGPEKIIKTAKVIFSEGRRLQIDIIVNNAGITDNKPLAKLVPDDFARLYAVNVIGPAMLVKAAIPHLPSDRSGRIVNVSSLSASMGNQNQTVYSGTKAALEAMTRVWSRELAELATVNAINPGPVATDMWGKVDENFLDNMRPVQQMTPLARVREDVDADEMVEEGKKMGGRAAYPFEIAGLVAMLCGEDAGWCTGSVICANGGSKFSY